LRTPRPLQTLALAGLTLSALTGCASVRAGNARSAYLNNAALNYTYHAPCANLWPQARTLLFERGYQVRDTGEGGTFTLETLELHEKDNTESTRSRYLVQALQPSPTTCQIHFTLNQTTHAKGQTPSTSTGRDPGIELQLIDRTEPDHGNRIHVEAEAAGERARHQG
jgi:uncharacterized lipoprotein